MTAARQLQKKEDQDLVKFVENLKRQWVQTIDALVDPLMIVSQDYTIQKANLALARSAGTNVKEVIGTKCYTAFAGRTSPCPGCKMNRTGTPGEATTFHLEKIRGDRFFEVTSQPLHSADGEHGEVVQVYRDRTEARKLQEQLSQQDKLASIGLLAGGIAHEINNPLGGILIFSQMLLKELPKESPHYEDVVEIEAATQRCKAIVESLLDFARQNPAGSTGNTQDINVQEAIRTAVRFAKVGIARKGSISIRESYLKDAPVIRGDRNKIIQVFLNLIQNAIQAMPDGGSLSIRSTVSGQDGNLQGHFAVTDTGIGIPPEHLKRIFDPFFTTKEPGEGTGLGLALSYGIVQDLGGSMSVESKVNGGTTFRVSLPLAGQEPDRDEPRRKRGR